MRGEDADIDTELFHRGHGGVYAGIQARRDEEHAGPVKDDFLVVDRTQERIPVSPNLRPFVGHGDHAGLCVEAPHDAAGGGCRTVAGVAVLIDHGDLKPAALQFQRHGAADDSGADDTSFHSCSSVLCNCSGHLIVDTDLQD